jgi:hypothetical protein
LIGIDKMQKVTFYIQMGKIQAIIFTGLSRLTLSLKEFLTIFMVSIKNNFDTLCLVTEIDTTFPWLCQAAHPCAATLAAPPAMDGRRVDWINDPRSGGK